MQKRFLYGIEEIAHMLDAYHERLMSITRRFIDSFQETETPFSWHIGESLHSDVLTVGPPYEILKLADLLEEMHGYAEHTIGRLYQVLSETYAAQHHGYHRTSPSVFGEAARICDLCRSDFGSCRDLVFRAMYIVKNTCISSDEIDALHRILEEYANRIEMLQELSHNACRFFREQEAKIRCMQQSFCCSISPDGSATPDTVCEDSSDNHSDEAKLSV